MIRAVSWNIELGLNIAAAAETLTTHPNLSGADIVLAQEVSAEGTAELAELLQMHAAYDSAAPHCKTGESFGNAILSTSPLRDVVPIQLPHVAPVNGQPRSAVFATSSIGGADLLIGSIHLETVLLALRRRCEQLQPIADFIEAAKGPVLIGGDFNAASGRSIKAFENTLEPAGLQRPTNYTQTFRRFGRPFALDHFFVRGCGTADTGVVATAEISDHDPIWIEFEPGGTRSAT